MVAHGIPYRSDHAQESTSEAFSIRCHNLAQLNLAVFFPDQSNFAGVKSLLQTVTLQKLP
jgi:hypothetical protein